jgi:formylglycine-generating enzyme required for sulfatase activity
MLSRPGSGCSPLRPQGKKPKKVKISGKTMIGFKKQITLLFFPFWFFALNGLAWSELRDLGLEQVSGLEQRSGVKAGTYRALIIGINDYQDPRIPDLKTPENDARELEQLLKKDYGFEDVVCLIGKDAGRSKINEEFRNLGIKSKEDDSVFIYFAGHGDKDQFLGGFWAPYDADSRDSSTSIPNSTIQTYIKNIPARHVLLVSDSCFSGTLFGDEARNFPKIIDDKLYASLFKKKSRWAMTSGDLTPVEDSGSKGHSIFAWKFIEALRESDKPFFTPMQIHDKIAPLISNNSDQVPQCQSIKNTGDDGGSFIFIRTASLGLPPSPQAVIPPPPPKKELLYALLKIGTNPSGAEIFIDGKRVGDTQGGYLVWEQYLVGEYNVKASKKGYYEKEVMLRLRKDGETLIIDMDPSTPPPAPAPAPVAPKVSPVTQAPEGMVFVKGDCFQMGDQFDDEDAGADEQPVHEACVGDFYMDKYEVTQKNFQRVMRNNPSDFKNCDDCPVEQVTWDEAKGYCEDAGVGKRLPTEAEWEFAAREGGKKVRFGTGKDTIGPDEANFNASANFKRPYSRIGEYREKTLPVGSFAPNALGLYDMSGNVWEWVSDWYDKNYYSSSPKDNPQGPSSRESRVLRGGSWRDDPSGLRAADRGWGRPSFRFNGSGFRCVRPVR